MRVIFYVLSMFVLSSCTNQSSDDNSHLRNPQYPNKNQTFTPENFSIKKHSIGNIKIGMLISQLENELSYFKKKEIDVWQYGYDGGGIAYEYSIENQPIFGIIPYINSDSIIALIALDSTIKTNNGVSPKMSVADLIKIYPKNLFYKDLLSGEEYLYDSINQWTFVFNDDIIIDIADVDNGSKAKNLKPKMDWIEIK